MPELFRVMEKDCWFPFKPHRSSDEVEIWHEAVVSVEVDGQAGYRQEPPACIFIGHKITAAAAVASGVYESKQQAIEHYIQNLKNDMEFHFSQIAAIESKIDKAREIIATNATEER